MTSRKDGARNRCISRSRSKYFIPTCNGARGKHGDSATEQWDRFRELDGHGFYTVYHRKPWKPECPVVDYRVIG